MNWEIHYHFRAMVTGDSNGSAQLQYKITDEFESQAGGPLDIHIVWDPDPVIPDNDTDVVIHLCCGDRQIPVFFPLECMFECMCMQKHIQLKEARRLCWQKKASNFWRDTKQ